MKEFSGKKRKNESEPQEERQRRKKVKITRSIMSDNEEDIMRYKESDIDEVSSSEIAIKRSNDSGSEDESDDSDVLNRDMIVFPNVVEVHSNRRRRNTKINNNVSNGINDNVISTQRKMQPWQQCKNCISLKYQGMIKLHYEILEFYEYMKLTPKETQLREDTFSFLEHTITSSFSSFTLSKYGSFLTDLSLPDSDIDIVITPSASQTPTTPEATEKLLHKITTLLLSTNQFTYIEIIKARVPIIKATYKQTNINIDISLHKRGFEQQSQLLIEILNEYPHMRHLIYTLKYFLRQKKLNDLHSGGISSYILFHMVYFYLLSVYKLKETSHNSELLTLGHLLLGFFQLYGFDVNYEKVGMSVRYGGFYYEREKKVFGSNGSKGKHMLSFENCVDVEKDLGKYCYKYAKVVDCFKMARDALYYPGEFPVKSWLGMLIYEDELMKGRKVNK